MSRRKVVPSNQPTATATFEEAVFKEDAQQQQ
jgi:hypothetical protein